MQMLVTMLVTIEVITVLLGIVQEAENSGKRTVVGTLIKVKDVNEPTAALNIDGSFSHTFLDCPKWNKKHESRRNRSRSPHAKKRN